MGWHNGELSFSLVRKVKFVWMCSKEGDHIFPSEHRRGAPDRRKPGGGTAPLTYSPIDRPVSWARGVSAKLCKRGYSIGTRLSRPFLQLTVLLLFASAAPARGQDQNVITVEPGPDAVEGGGVSFNIKRAYAHALGVSGIKYSWSQEGYWVVWGGSTTGISGGLSQQTITLTGIPGDNIDKPNGSVTLKVNTGAGYVVGSPWTATVPVADDDPTPVTLSAVAGDIEEGGSKTLTVSLGRALVAGEQLTVALTFGGQASFGADYSLSAPDPAPAGVSYTNLSSDDLTDDPPSIVFTGGANAAAAATLILESSRDRVMESSETVSVGLGTLTAGEGLGGGASAVAGGASFSIDDATKILVGIAAAADPVTEGTNAAFTLTADIAPTADVTVEVALTLVGGSYLKDEATSKNVVIKKGATTAGFALETVGDTVDEAPGSVTAAIQNDPAYIVGPNDAASVNIQDDDPTSVTLEVTDAEAIELTTRQSAAIRVRIGRRLRFDEKLSVPLLFSGSTPRANLTLELVRSASTVTAPSFNPTTDILTFNPGFGRKTGAAVADIRVSVTHPDGNAVDDTIIADIPRSSTGTPSLGAAKLQGGALGTRSGDGEIDVLDLEARRTFRISGGSAVDEGGTASFTVHADRKTARSTIVFVDVTQEGDFAAASSLGRKQVRVLQLATSGTLNVPTVGDDKNEAHGKIVATISANNAYVVAAKPDDSAAVTVNDDDDPPATPPVAKFAAASATAAETAGSTMIDVALSPAPTAELTLKYTLSGSAALGTDYAIAGASDGAGTLTIPKDSTAASIKVAITDDALGEGNETVVLSLADGTGYALGTPARFTLTIADDEPALAISASAPAVSEGTAATFAVTANQAVAADVKASVTVAAGGDFVAADDLGAQTVTIAKGKKTAALSIPTADDETDEPNGWIRATLDANSAYTIPKPPNNSAQVAVNDDDDPPVDTPVAKFAAASATAAETAGSTMIDVALSPAPTAELTLKYTLSGSAALGTDYAIAGASDGAGTLTIPKDSTAASIKVAITDDALGEGNETVVLSLADGTGYALGTPARFTLTIADDEPALAISASAPAVSEGTAATFAVTANQAVAADVKASVTVAAGGDFVAADDLGAQTVTIAKGKKTAALSIPTADDETDEPNGWIRATLDANSAYTIPKPPNNSAQCTVNDNDNALPVVSISGGATVTEGGEASFDLTASPAPTESLAVDVSIDQNGDFAAQGQTGQRTITLGVSGTVRFNVATADDNAEETNGTIRATVQNGTGYVAADPPANSALVAVNDNDTETTTTEVTLSATPNPVQEGEYVTITVSFSQPLDNDIAIPLMFTPETAEPDDFVMLALITIRANETSAQGAIAILEDDDPNDETFTVSLGTLPENLVAGTPSSTTLLITDKTNVTSVEPVGEEIPAAFALEQNYPNPFNPSTTIEFALDKTQRITLSAYDMLGQEVRVLMDGVQPAGRYRVSFDGSGLASGTYLYILRTEEQVAVKTMALLK